MDSDSSTLRQSADFPATNSQAVHLSFHLPNFGLRSHSAHEAADLRLRILEEHRLSQTSSVYNDDDEWNRQVARLSTHSEWVAPANRDHIPISHEFPIERRVQNHSSDVLDSSSDVLEKGYNTPASSIEISRDLRTRNVCAFALVLGILVGVASFAAGCQIVTSGKVLLPDFLRGKFMNMGAVDYPFPAKTSIHYLSGHRVFPVPEAAMLTINFILNVCLTALFDCMAFIHNTTLRWSLCKEGRLVYNSNPRLFSGAHHFAPNWRITNALCSLALVIGYGSISALTYSINIVGMVDAVGRLQPDEPLTGPRYAIDFSGWGFVGLGISLLMQGAVSSWCLTKSKIVPTWSSNPFNTALVCSILGLAQKNSPASQKVQTPDGTTSPFGLPKRMDTKSLWLASQETGQGLLVTMPQRRQPAMNTEVARCRRFTYFIWAVFALIILWLLLNAVFAAKADSCNRDFVSQMEYRSDFLGYFESYCRVSIPYYINPFFDRRDWLGLIIQCIVFSVIILALHCGEMLTDITRDEAAWRKATTAGADTGRGALIEGATSWECWVTFAFKSITPWMFGLAFNTNLEVISNLIPLCILALIILLLGVFAEYLVRRRPKGPQPCTFGNIAKLAGLVDEWHPKIFWGDKGSVDNRIRKAGTAGQRLADLDMSTLYENLRVY